MKNKKLIIISIIASLIFAVIVYVLFKPTYYILQVNTGVDYNYASGVLTRNTFKGTFYLNVNFDNPNYHCTVGLFIYDEYNKELNLLESSNKKSDTGECGALQTPSGYLITNKTFMRREKSTYNGNIITQMIKNKENTYLCISKNNIENLTIEDCHRVEFQEYK